MDKKNDGNERLFLDHRSRLLDGMDEQAKELDKRVLTLATGALALSITFINQIAPHPKPATIAVLNWAWGLLGFTILTSVVSVLFGQLAYRLEIRKWDEDYQDIKDYESKNHWSIATWITNLLALTGLFIGISLLAWFASSNIRL